MQTRSLLQRGVLLPGSRASPAPGKPSTLVFRPVLGLCKQPAAAPMLPQRQVSAAARRLPLPPAAGSGKEPQDSRPVDRGETEGLLGSAGLFLLWAGLAFYAFFVSPNQTPLRDQYFLEKLVGLGVADGVPLNTIVQNLFLIMGVWPLVYTALLIPSGKSGNGVPAWPFITLSYAFGAFGLLPFMALWQPPSQPPKVPADAADLEGVGNLMQKGMESPAVAFLCLAGAAWCVGNAVLAGPAQWNAYFKLLEESRFINVMSCDFLALTALAPFWVSNDAALRRWEGRDSLLPILSFLPVFGPVIYLCLRPRAQV